MDNQTPPVFPTGPTSGPVSGKYYEPELSQKTFTLPVFLLAVFLTAFVFGVGAWLITLFTTGGVQSNKPTPQPSATPAPTTEFVEAPFKLVYHTSTTSEAAQTDAAKLGLTAPLNWRTQILGLSSAGSALCASDPNLTLDKSCFSFSFANILGDPTSFAGQNSISFYNLDSWMQSAPTSAVNPLGGTTDPKKKATLIAAVKQLTSQAALSPDSISSLFNPFLSNATLEGVANAQYIQSSDGKLKGYSFLASQFETPVYDPTAYAVLVGEINGTTMALVGQFRINDAERKINHTPSFFTDTYRPGYKYAQDALDQYDKAMGVMKSIRLEQ